MRHMDYNWKRDFLGIKSYLSEEERAGFFLAIFVKGLKGLVDVASCRGCGDDVFFFGISGKDRAKDGK